MQLPDAIRQAQEEGFDLICVSPEANPPVCRIGDYGKLRYEMMKKEKSGKKKDRSGQLKELKMRPKISEHDYQVRFHKAIECLGKGYKVKMTMSFRGREMTHRDIGQHILDRFSEEIKEYGLPEAKAKLEGRNMSMILAPNKQGKENAKNKVEKSGP